MNNIPDYANLVGLAKELVDYELLITYLIFCIALFSALIFPAIELFKDLKKTLITLGGVVVVAAFFLLCYSLAKGEPYTTGDTSVTAEGMKFVGAILFMTYVMFGISILSILYASISSYFK